MTIRYDRQELIINPTVAQDAKVVVFGCGTVGSNVAVEAARLGIGNFDLYDFDIVEAHNIPSQRFTKDQMEMLKVDATADQINSVSNDANVTKHNRKVEGPVIVGDSIVILAVDSMKSRADIRNVLRRQPSIKKVLDFRMSGNKLQCYAFDYDSTDYDGTLFDDDVADPTPCGGRTVSYTGALSGAIAANYIRKVLNGDSVPFTTVIDMDSVAMIAM